MKTKLTTICLTFVCVVLLSGTAAVAEPLVWDTIATSTAWDTGVPTGSGNNIALSVSNNGEMGQMGIGGVNLDFTVDGGETGTRPADSIYLRSGSLFLMRHDGDSVVLTTSIAQKNWISASEYDSISYDFVPVPDGGPMSSGFYECDGRVDYDSVYTGRFLSRDSSVAIERVYYANRQASWSDSYFVVAVTRVFAGYKGNQSHLSIGTVIDWDIPADLPAVNQARGHYEPAAAFAIGTDTSGGVDDLHASRCGYEVMLKWIDQDGNVINSWGNPDAHYGSFATPYAAIQETPVTGEPDGSVWWDSISFFGPLGEVDLYDDTDLVIFYNYLHDFDLGESDTLVFHTALATSPYWTYEDLRLDYTAAYEWEELDLRTFFHTCCMFTVGDLDHTFNVDISDLQIMIDNQFLTLTPIWCPASADVNWDGEIDIVDISIVVDHLFLTLTPMLRCQGVCPR